MVKILEAYFKKEVFNTFIAKDGDDALLENHDTEKTIEGIDEKT